MQRLPWPRFCLGTGEGSKRHVRRTRAGLLALGVHDCAISSVLEGRMIVVDNIIHSCMLISILGMVATFVYVRIEQPIAESGHIWGMFIVFQACIFMSLIGLDMVRWIVQLLIS